jgi:flavin-dependent dehydrogenase
LEGAPLRTALEGSKLSRPGLLVVGEAAGLTYSFSGEGIGKAMESGIMAATLVGDALRAGNGTREDVPRRYDAWIRSEFTGRFRAYKLAQDWLAWPQVANFLAWRARSGRYARTQMEGLLAETTDPRALFSPSGLLKALVR